MTKRFCAGVLASGALALSAVAGQFPDPADPSAQVPRLERRSSLSEYRRFGDETIAPWRKVHEEVAEPAGSGHHHHGHAEGAAAQTDGGAHERHEHGAPKKNDAEHAGHAAHDHGGEAPPAAGHDMHPDHGEHANHDMHSDPEHGGHDEVPSPDR
jgi:hypothetical protein